LWGCSDDHFLTPSSDDVFDLKKSSNDADKQSSLTTEFEKYQADNILKEFARALSSLINEPDVRSLLKQEAIKQVDGDFDILYSQIRGFKFPDNQTFGSKIMSLLKGKVSASDLDALKLLTISIPVHIEKWDVNNFVPSVVYVDSNHKEGKMKVKGFDTKQADILVADDKTPDIPYVVVRLNFERYNLDGTIRNEILESINIEKSTKDHNQLVEERDPVYGSDGNPEWFGLFDVPDLSQIESWLQGKPEIQVRVVSNLNPAIKTWQLKQYARSSYGQSGMLLENTNVLPSWTTSIQGVYLNYFFLEIDGDGSSTSSTITIPSANGQPGISVTHSFKTGDRQMGNQSVYHGDDINFFYTLGIFMEFKVRTSPIVL
jgi:hypothetical protein